MDYEVITSEYGFACRAIRTPPACANDDCPGDHPEKWAYFLAPAAEDRWLFMLATQDRKGSLTFDSPEAACQTRRLCWAYGSPWENVHANPLGLIVTQNRLIEQAPKAIARAIFEMPMDDLRRQVRDAEAIADGVIGLAEFSELVRVPTGARLN